MERTDVPLYLKINFRPIETYVLLLYNIYNTHISYYWLFKIQRCNLHMEINYAKWDQLLELFSLLFI